MSAKVPKLPPLPRLRVDTKKASVVNKNPCYVMLASLLNCWASNGEGSAICNPLENKLSNCMVNMPKNRGASYDSLNYHAARLKPKINGSGHD
ncbi:unnamed protein product [Kuraishia capsulata CBS 1993]|uniref:37S ribosomal protein mrp10, mitochondrial n=1 Tax=Kuraishia capsulata CBS 1993 TaxID=1382522 RepID=W6MMN4_9ASCO|nr:uncharacterized protein KUCA_T00003843001 [Kuraishia capsulata CBS 1993]CDK27864.1 unnamed protein product [Kuraishia capsulata CBS 1993]